MPDEAVEVEWQVAEDERFRRIAARGTERATSELAHSVHAEARGLQPDRVYWYRFRSGSALSPVGRTRTAPAGHKARIRFAFASCQQYEQGWFSAYRDMAARDLDLVVHLGDYIYERSWGSHHVREHGVGIPTTLPEYRTQKVYSSLLRRRLETARDAGYNVATIHAEPMSRRVVARYGFEPQALFDVYAWMPVIDAAVIATLVQDD